MRRHQMAIWQGKQRGEFRAPRIIFCCRKVGCISKEAGEQPKTRLERLFKYLLVTFYAPSVVNKGLALKVCVCVHVHTRV